MSMEKLDILATKVEELLALHHSVCEERDRLSRELEETKVRLEESVQQLQEHERERSEVRNRVERILERLNGLGLS